jgi:hypothetical protein
MTRLLIRRFPGSSPGAHHRNRKWNGCLSVGGAATVEVAASGAQTARIAIDHRTDAAIGCCLGHVRIEAAGFGFPKRSRAAAVTALTGFQSATVRGMVGMPWVATTSTSSQRDGIPVLPTLQIVRGDLKGPQAHLRVNRRSGMNHITETAA